MADVLRPLLDERRARIAADTDLRGTAAVVAAQLDDLRAGVEGWHLTRGGFDAVGGGLRRTARLARRAAGRALARPSGARFHAWRTRVKDLWLQVRAIQPRVGGRLTALEASLERLDGVLGQYHDCTLLRELLLARPRRFPPETATCLRLVRRAQVALRCEARLLAVEVHRLRSKALTAHVHALWRAARPRAVAQETPCRAA